MPQSPFRQFLSRLFGAGRSNPVAPRDPGRVPAPVIVPRAAPSPAPPPSDPEAMAEEARDIVRRAVRTGFDDREQLIGSAIEMLEDEYDPDAVRAIVPALVDEELAAHRKAELGWPAITDCDRLDAAFAALEDAGIVARQNFTCCGTCGSAEIWDEIGEARDRAGRCAAMAFITCRTANRRPRATASISTMARSKRARTRHWRLGAKSSQRWRAAG